MAFHTLLVVEDEFLIRCATCDHLRDCDFDVIEAANADDAVVLLNNHQEIALVFTDVQMPGTMDGLDLARWVTEVRPHVPVMIATGNPARLAAMNNFCATETFLKPYDQDRVVDRIRHILAKKHRV